MKKINLNNLFILSIVIILLSLFSCSGEKEKIEIYEFDKKGLIFEDEYSGLSDFEKDIADLINASIGGLKGILINRDASKCYAGFTIKNDKDYKKWEGIIFAIENDSSINPKLPNCRVTGLISAKRCVKAIKNFVMENDGCADVHIVYYDGGFNISWESCNSEL